MIRKFLAFGFAFAWTMACCAAWVTFEPFGGTCSPSADYYSSGDTFGCLPTPIREGCKFAGWYTEPTWDKKITEDDMVPWTDCTLYARWWPEDGQFIVWAQTVQFNPNGGECAVSLANYAAELTYGWLPKPVRAGYMFLGWKWWDEWLTTDTVFYPHAFINGESDGPVAQWKGRPGKYKLTVRSSSTKQGSVSGSGTYTSGSKVTIKAYPKAGYVFSYWSWESEDGSSSGTIIPSGSYREMEPVVTIRMPYGATKVNANFIAKKSDSILFDTSDHDWYLSDDLSYYLCICSGSRFTVSAKGLPKGISLSRGRMRVTKLSSVGYGVKTVTLTAKNASGKKASLKVRIHAPNRQTAVQKGVLEIDTSDEGYQLRAGLKIAPIEAWVASGWAATVSGLPPGLKWNAATQKITGMPTKPGVYTATFKVYRGKTAYYATSTFTVRSLPSTVAGSYNGYLSYDWQENYDENATMMGPFRITNAVCSYWGACDTPVKVSVSSAGKISAKVGTVAFSANGFDSVEDGVYRVALYWKKKFTSGKYKGCYASKTLDLVIDTNEPWTGHQLRGYYSVSGNSCLCGLSCGAVVAQKNPYGKYSWGAYKNPDAGEIAKAAASIGSRGMVVDKAKGGYDIVCLECLFCPDGKLPTPVLKAKVSTSGVVTLSGRIGGKKVSGTAVLEVGEKEFHDDGGWSRPCCAHYVLRPDSSTVFKVVLEYLQDDSYGFCSPCGWAEVTK